MGQDSMKFCQASAEIFSFFLKFFQMKYPSIALARQLFIGSLGKVPRF